VFGSSEFIELVMVAPAEVQETLAGIEELAVNLFHIINPHFDRAPVLIDLLFCFVAIIILVSINDALN
jgi:hypothetical protein